MSARITSDSFSESQTVGLPGVQASDEFSAYVGWGSLCGYWDRLNARVVSDTKVVFDGVWSIEGHKTIEIDNPTRKLVMGDLMARIMGQGSGCNNSQFQKMQMSLRGYTTYY